MLLLANGTGVNIKNKSGRTPLHLAVIGPFKEVVEILWRRIYHREHLEDD